MGPINEWWTAGFDGGENALIGFSTGTECNTVNWLLFVMYQFLYARLVGTVWRGRLSVCPQSL